MPAGVAIPMLIGAGVSAGTTIYSAKKQADAAKQAAATQVAGTKDAQAYIDKGYQQAQSALSPWLTTGSAAATTLGGLMGLPITPAASGSPPTTSTPTTTTPNALSAWSATSPEQAYTSSPYTRRAVKNYTYDPENNPDPSQMGIFASTPEAKNATGYTMMKAPTGEFSYVMNSKVPYYTNLGATVVE